MNAALIHLEHALPALAELGLEHLVPAFLAGGRVALDPDTLGRILRGLAAGAQKHSARLLVAVSCATADDLLAWEVDPSKEAAALKAAAMVDLETAKTAIAGFFESLGLSLDISPSSSGEMTQGSASPAHPTGEY